MRSNAGGQIIIVFHLGEGIDHTRYNFSKLFILLRGIEGETWPFDIALAFVLLGEKIVDQSRPCYLILSLSVELRDLLIRMVDFRAKLHRFEIRVETLNSSPFC